MNHDIIQKNVNPNDYYISTGEHMVYFTLWRRPGSYSQEYLDDVYIGNLSTDYETAIAKAKAKLGFVPEIVHEPVNRPKERNHIDNSIIQFGKYAGIPIWLVYKYDPDYIGWAYENCNSQKTLPNINYIQKHHNDFIQDYLQAAKQEVEKQKQLAQERNKKIIAEKKASQYVGTVGKSIEIEIKTLRIIPIESYWGQSALHIMKDKQGNEIKWFCSNTNNVLKEGENHKIKARVKNHSAYHENINIGNESVEVPVNQTVVTHVKKL